MALGRPIEQTPNIADKVVTATATAGQTEFTVTGGYRINHLAVFRNGVRLVNGNDYTALDGTTVTLMEDASNLDVLEFQVFDTFSVSDALLTNAASQTVNGDVTVNGAFTVGSGGIGTFTAATVKVGIVSSSTGITTIQSLQASSSTTTGALQVKGGVGIGKSLYVGGNLSVGGTVTYEDITNVDSVGLVTAGLGLRATAGGLVVTAGVSTFAGITTVTNTAALHSKQLNVSAGSTFGGAVTLSDTLTVAGNVDIADKIIHTGDTNTAIRFPSADTVTVETGGSERIRITSGGLVLVGTTATGFSNGYTNMTLGSTSDTNTGLTIASSASDGISRLHFADGTSGTARYAGWIAYDQAADEMKFSTNNSGSSKVVFTKNGQVIVGAATTDDTSQILKLHQASNDHCTLSLGVSNASYSSLINFGDDSAWGVGQLAYVHSSDAFTFKTNGDNERLRISSAGVIGANTSSPITDLHTNYRAVQNHNYGVWSTDDGGASFFSNNAYTNTSGNWVRIANDHAMDFGMDDGNFYFRNVGAGTGTITWNRPLTIDSSGRVLMGTTTEGHTSADNLTVYDSGDCGITIRSGTTHGASLFFSDATSGAAEYEGYVQYQHNTGSLAFGAGQNQRATLTGIGSFGLGITSPETLLHVEAANDEAVIKLQRTGTTIGGSIGVRDGSGDKGLTYIAKDGNSAVPNHVFQTDGGSGATERMRITPYGDVGIGSATPWDASWGTQGNSKHLSISGTTYGVLSLEGSNGAYTKWSMGAGDSRFYMAYSENTATHCLDVVSSTKDVHVMAGNLVMGTNNKGVDFQNQTTSAASGITVSSEILDHYEKGSWTPTISSGGFTIGSNSYSKYVRIGDLVHVQFYIGLAGTGNGNNLTFGGLPYAVNTNGYSVGTVDFGLGGVKGAYMRTTSGDSTLSFFYPSENVSNNRENLTGNQVGASYVIATITYLVD